MKLPLHAVTTLALAAAALAAYDRFVVQPSLRVGVVDLNDVYRQKETEFTLGLTRAGSDAEREQTLKGARLFAQRLPAALEELPSECGCLVLLRTSLAAPTHRIIDLTARLRHKVEAP